MYVMDFVSHRLASFHPYVILFDVTTKGVVFCGTLFTFWHVDEAASRCIVVEVDTTAIAVATCLIVAMFWECYGNRRCYCQFCSVVLMGVVVLRSPALLRVEQTVW